MSERRTSQVLVDLEYAGATNQRKVSEILVQIEYTGATNKREVTQVLLMVEYSKPWPAAGRVQGPAAQTF